MSGERPSPPATGQEEGPAVMPPVRLPSEAELARQALAAPLLARAVRLARWCEPGVRVGAGGELTAAGLRERRCSCRSACRAADSRGRPPRPRVPWS
ncbi:hypothetical protein [Streptomyces sp. NPDC048845]|uniref:hypothetical protein n=1 Tax=Streptomyces sp. NPDC048845 TaxID=3155390 RepID=UPI003412EE50